MTAINEKYIDLMKNVLIDMHRIEKGEYLPVAKMTLFGKKKVWGVLDKWMKSYGMAVCKEVKFTPDQRLTGRDWPVNADSMIGLKRMENIEYCVKEVIRNNVPGDLIETGVWRGGATIFMRAILYAFGVTDRTVWVADSFEGLPKPDEAKYEADKGDIHHIYHKELAIPLESVQYNFKKYGLLDNQVKFLKGWFKDTLPTAPIKQLAVARLDGDMYESTIDALNSLYPKLSVGGFLIVDDWGAVEGCRKAVLDYREKHGITEEIIDIDGLGVYWKRER
ncbi:macrocin O-methyltransferase [Chitinophaga lutea]|uniref:Macrocin O-methyltransferase n=1 Tax=Chitinophaga lutea TaxID=2488634 RepID=A0A3N4Q2E4_9BACT|nr:TylF/MycF family methyltransferase [Chitinophaga lutea]RPE05944.1 macrocin O-methyltransferase [Chitinophaga lutea]